jgi:hypothetical protein
MAYMSQEKKAKLAPLIKKICSKYGIKATLAVRSHSTLVINVKEGRLDFLTNYHSTTNKPASNGLSVNPYWYQDHFSGNCKKFLAELLAAANDGNHDRSDAMTDYFDVGWYVDVNIGQWNKPYILTK